jgi:hypothetical protein
MRLNLSHSPRLDSDLLSSLLSILLHTRLNPLASLCCLLVHLGLVLEQLLDCVRVGHVAALFNTRARSKTLLPCLERREVLDIDARPAGSYDPSPVCEIWWL